jgi:hypothetical protein
MNTYIVNLQAEHFDVCANHLNRVNSLANTQVGVTALAQSGNLLVEIEAAAIITSTSK